MTSYCQSCMDTFSPSPRVARRVALQRSSTLEAPSSPKSAAGEAKEGAPQDEADALPSCTPLERYIIDILSTVNFIVCDGAVQGFPIVFASRGFRQAFSEACIGKNCGRCVGYPSMNDADIGHLAETAGLGCATVVAGLEAQTRRLVSLVKGIVAGPEKHVSSLVVNRLVAGLHTVHLTMHCLQIPRTGGVVLVGTQQIVDDKTSLASLLRAYASEGAELAALEEPYAPAFEHVRTFMKRDTVPPLLDRLLHGTPTSPPLLRRANSICSSATGMSLKNLKAPSQSRTLRTRRPSLPLQIRKPSGTSGSESFLNELQRRGYSAETSLLAGGFTATKLYLVSAKGAAKPELVVKFSKDAEAIVALEAEYNVLKRLSHRTIVPVEEWIRGPSDEGPLEAGFLMRACPGTTLRKAFNGPPLAWRDLRFIVTELLAGVEYLHGEGVAHRDLHTGNIVVDTELRSVVIVDFGSARRGADSPLSPPACGASVCASTDSPALTDSRGSSVSVGFGTLSSMLPPPGRRGDALQRDVFALGLVLVGLLCWQEASTEDVYAMNEREGSYRSKITWPEPLERASASTRKLLSDLLHLHPSSRCTAAEARVRVPSALGGMDMDTANVPKPEPEGEATFSYVQLPSGGTLKADAPQPEGPEGEEQKQGLTRLSKTTEEATSSSGRSTELPSCEAI